MRVRPLRAPALSLAYLAAELGLAWTRPTSPACRWAAMAAMFAALPWAAGFAGRRLELSSRSSLAAVLAPAALLALLMLPFLALESLSRQRSPGAGGVLHVALTGVLILGAILGAQGACALWGWERGQKKRGPGS